MPSPARGNRRTWYRGRRTFRRRTGYNDDTMLLLGYSPIRRIWSYVPYTAYFPLPGRESSRFIPISFSINISRRDSSLRRQGKETAVGSRTTGVTCTRLRFRYRPLAPGPWPPGYKNGTPKHPVIPLFFNRAKRNRNFVFCILYSAFCILYSVFRLPRPRVPFIFCRPCRRDRPCRRGRPCRPCRLRNRRWRSSARCGLRPRP